MAGPAQDATSVEVSSQSEALLFPQNWLHTASLSEPNRLYSGTFGSAIAASGDFVIAASAAGSSTNPYGRVRIFKASPTGWTTDYVVTVPTGLAYVRPSVAIDGMRVAISDSQRTRVLERTSTGWVERASIAAIPTSRRSSQRLTLSGSTLAISQANRLLVYRQWWGGWYLEATLQAPSYQSIGSAEYGSIALSGDLLVASAPWGSRRDVGDAGVCFAGRLDVWRRAGSAWTLETQLVGEQLEVPVTNTIACGGSSGLGAQLHISGNDVVATAERVFTSQPSLHDATYVFRYDSTGWTRSGALPAATGATLSGSALALIPRGQSVVQFYGRSRWGTYELDDEESLFTPGSAMAGTASLVVLSDTFDGYPGRVLRVFKREELVFNDQLGFQP